MKERANRKKVDPVILGCYIFLLVFGWMNIYASSTQDTGFNAFDPSAKYAMQLIWIGSAVVIDILVLRFIPKSFYNVFSLVIYLFTLALLLLTVFIGKEVNGSRSWLEIGTSVRIQPAEFSKVAVALMLSSIMEKFTFSFKNRRDTLKVLLVLALPAVCILLEKETGLILVYAAFFLVFYREGMSGWVLVAGLLAILFFILTLVLSPFTAIVIWTALVAIYAAFSSRNFWLTLGTGAAFTALLAHGRLIERIDGLQPFLNQADPEIWAAAVLVPLALGVIIYSLFEKSDRLRRMATVFILGVGFIISCDFAFNSLLQDHQRLRIEELLGMKDDPMGAGYNVRQSMIAIGSGGFSGKGFTQGTQTRFDFVPEQSTDFIFCTVGEEWGFLGSLAVIICYALMIIRLFNSAERQKDRFNRIFGYCVASCILLHVVINLGMTIGLTPVIGIPLPMLSYGGSSLWVFSILIFVYLRLDMESKW